MTPIQLIEALEQAQEGADWVKEMHNHFRQNGFYRAEDLNRLLGDPRDHVALAAHPYPCPRSLHSCPTSP